MGKIVVVFLCFFIVIVWGSIENREKEKSQFLEKMKQLEKFHEEFKEFKASLIEKSSAFVQFPQSSTSNGSAEKTGRTGETREIGETGKPGETTETGQTGKTTVAGQTGESKTTENPVCSTFTDPRSISSCDVAMATLPSPRSGKQTIYPHGNDNSTSLEVLCDFETDVDGGGWTVIQKRSSGPQQEFHRNWTEYSNGFGSLDGNFWLGLDNIHTLTKNGDQELRIELEDFDGNKTWAKYSNFSISDASDFYRLSISGFSSSGTSTAGDSMTGSHSLNQMQFSTKDKDNDKTNNHCAELVDGGWWYNACGLSRLNGLYREKGESGYGIRWGTWTNEFLAKTEMKIRKRKSA